MRDLRRTDIEDIDRHIHCYKLLFRFLRQEKKYHQMMNILFYSKGRSLYDLIETINSTPLGCILVNIPCSFNTIDKKWSAIFSYVPFFGCKWGSCLEVGENSEERKRTMSSMSYRWCIFVMENKDKCL